MMPNSIIEPHALPKSHWLGFSLVELMVAMSLSLLLMLGIYKVFDFQQRSFQLISSLNEREDNAQLAMTILSDEIRMADHWGGVASENITKLAHSLVAAPGNCNVSWVFDVSKGVLGIEGQSSLTQLNNLPNNCLHQTHYVKHSDLIALRFGASRHLFYDQEIKTKRYQKHYFLRSQAGKSAVLFQGKDISLATKNLPDEGAHYNMAYASRLYFLRPCKRTSQGCIEGSSVLTRLVLMGNRYIQEALVEGIEQMQFEYGVDENKDTLVDRYLPANDVIRWDSVLSVKIYLLVRNSLMDTSIDEKGNVYVMNSHKSLASNVYEVPAQARHYPRRLYEREVVLKNRVFN